MIVVTSSFSKIFVFKIFSAHTKTQSRPFQIPPVCRAFSKNSVFVTNLMWTEGLIVEIKLRFQTSPV